MHEAQLLFHVQRALKVILEPSQTGLFKQRTFVPNPAPIAQFCEHFLDKLVYDEGK
jgi:hypothetical protein